jgi:hypothetical protein
MRQSTTGQRLRQSNLIQNWKPWKLAGVKNPEGKKISKLNALKHDARKAEVCSDLKELANAK